ncbi:MAG TPA: DUF5723 family protein [Chryseosolibacter sp.]|nr:DUF5723 family protein [Chryseosolibacter sp.]
MKTKVTILIALAVVFSTEAIAQLEGTMPFMQSLPQVTYYNPAFKPAYKFSIGLPGSSVFIQVSNNGFTYNDFVSEKDNLLTADLAQLATTLRKKNYINLNAQADLLRFSLKANARLYLTFNATLKMYNRIMLPRDVVNFFVQGTEAYVNRTATLSPEIEMMNYLETGFGASYTVDKKLTVGAKLKILKGVVNATTERSAFNISLADNYGITVSADLDMRSSGIHNFDSSEYEIQDNWKDYTKNNGFAIDLGATYKLTDKWTVGASIIDLGSIKWKNDTYGYSMNPETANYTFEGVDLDEVLNGDSDYGESLADSIEAKFDYKEGKIGKYKTPLPTKVYLSGVYQIRKMFSAGGLIGIERFRGRWMPAFTASLNKEFGKRVGASLSYTVTNNSFNNLGAGLSLNFAPVQFYIVGDNVLRLPLTLASEKNLNPYVNNLQYFNLRIGLNFVFGRDKVQEKQPESKTDK